MEIRVYPDPHLRLTAAPVERFGEAELRKTTEEMFRLMYECGGIGLAATQAGLTERIVVANLEAASRNKQTEEIFINPRMLKRSGETESDEGCLSLPDIRANLKRYKNVRVEYYDIFQKKHTVSADGLLAILFQHEIDHLDGILIIDRMPMSQKAMIQEDLRALEDEYKRGVKRVRRAASDVSF